MSKQIDPRGPRFGAAITSVLSLIIIWLSLDDKTNVLAYALLVIAGTLFAIGAVFGTSKHPYAWIYKATLKPILKAPAQTEDSKPPQFAQGVGLFVALIGIVLHLVNVRYGVLIAGVGIFFASALNAYFNYCLGCQIYLGLKRAGVIRG